MDLPVTNRGEQTRQAILEAAQSLFIMQGYHGTSMRQIAHDAGIALGGLYNHFNNKEAVFEAVFLAYHPYHWVLPLILEARGDNFEQLVQNAFKELVECVEGRDGFMNLMFIEVVEFKSAHTQQLFTKLLPQGMQLVQQLAQSFPDQVRPIPPHMLVRSFLSFFFGYYLTETALSPGAPKEFRENAMQHFIDIFLHGILDPTGTENL